MSVSEKAIASIVGEVKFRVDPKPLQMFDMGMVNMLSQSRAATAPAH